MDVSGETATTRRVMKCSIRTSDLQEENQWPVENVYSVTCLIHIKEPLLAGHIIRLKSLQWRRRIMTETQIQTDKPFPLSFDSGEFAALGASRRS